MRPVTLGTPNALLLPLPRKIELRAGRFSLAGSLSVRAPDRWRSPALGSLRAELERQGTRLDGGTDARAIELVVDVHSGHRREGYALAIDERCARVVASTDVGLAHGARTLAQLVRTATRAWVADGPVEEPGPPTLPALAIEDAPAFERRGVLLDVSRDRVPRMDFLFQLVERLAEWKLNELQLYCEHAFAYRGHERVWAGVDPFTADELRALDHHCAEHGIELVANQQSFGHLHHWLKHEPYRALSEVPEGIEHAFRGAGETQREPFSLCPTDPRSLEFLAGLYDELLPCFSSGEVHVGLDETIDLGQGRSAGACRARGSGRVYLDFLRSVHGLVSARGKRMHFWADILLSHPELVREVPKDAVACLWGYEADHPFESQTHAIAEAGLPFTVCPGTSSWLSIGGRLANMVANVHSAARWGAARGARGLLITDWGDRGHLQPPSVSWAGYATAADVAWNAATADTERHSVFGLSELLDQFLFGPWNVPDVGRTATMVASIAGTFVPPVRNASALSVLITKFDAPFPPPEIAGLRLAQLRATREQLGFSRPMKSERPTSPECALARRELDWAVRLMSFAARLGEVRIEAGGRSLEALAHHRRRALADELAPLVAEHRALWLERSRPGGLDRSARWLERPLEALRAS